MRRSKLLLVAELAILTLVTLLCYKSFDVVDREQGLLVNDKHFFSETPLREPERIIVKRQVDNERKTLLNSQCLQMNMTSNPNSLLDDKYFLNHVIVDEEHKLLYCYVPKVGTTNWKRLFMILMHKSNITDMLQIPVQMAHTIDIFKKLVNYPKKKVKEMMKTYTKFMFVRHPMERLLSAYIYMLTDDTRSSRKFKPVFGRTIIKSYRPNATEEELKKGENVTFEEFATYVSDLRIKQMNEHWRPFLNLCRPCAANYDVIGKHESYQEDADFILSHVSRTIRYPALPDGSKTRTMLKEYMQALPEALVERLQQIYEADFKLFDYQLEW